MSESTPRRRKRNYPYPHGTAIKLDQVVDKDDVMSDFFVTMVSVEGGIGFGPIVVPFGIIVPRLSSVRDQLQRLLY
jgi:hypothetical protein